MKREVWDIKIWILPRVCPFYQFYSLLTHCGVKGRTQDLMIFKNIYFILVRDTQKKTKSTILLWLMVVPVIESGTLGLQSMKVFFYFL